MNESGFTTYRVPYRYGYSVRGRVNMDCIRLRIWLYWKISDEQGRGRIYMNSRNDKNIIKGNAKIIGKQLSEQKDAHHLGVFLSKQMCTK